MAGKNNILYISYLGMSEAIPKSQVLPYLLRLSEYYNIHLLSFEKKEVIRNNYAEFKNVERQLEAKGISWHRLCYHKNPRVLSSFFDIFIGAIYAFYIVIRYRVSIVHARSNVPIAIGVILKMFTRIKLLYDRRGIMAKDHIEHSAWKEEGWLYRLAIYFENIAIKKSDAIVVLSEKMNICLKGNLKNNNSITTIPCCIDIDKFQYNHNARAELRSKLGLGEKFILAYSGSVGTYNLLDEMFDFFKVLRVFIPNSHFLILTQNKDVVSDLLLKRDDINKAEVTLMSVAGDDVPLYLSVADAALAFRRDSPTAIAASPTKLGEYLACGLPVISMSKIGDVAEILTANKIGIVIDSYNEDEYKKAISGLIFLFKEEKALRQRCRKFAEDFFSLERGVSLYRQIYDCLTKR